MVVRGIRARSAEPSDSAAPAAAALGRREEETAKPAAVSWDCSCGATAGGPGIALIDHQAQRERHAEGGVPGARGVRAYPEADMRDAACAGLGVDREVDGPALADRRSSTSTSTWSALRWRWWSGVRRGRRG